MRRVRAFLFFLQNCRFFFFAETIPGLHVEPQARAARSSPVGVCDIFCEKLAGRPLTNLKTCDVCVGFLGEDDDVCTRTVRRRRQCVGAG